LEETYKDQLEGLLQARSEDMGLARRRRRVRSAPGQVFERIALAPSVSSARCCDDCGAEIAARRLRAMPSATRCLRCQRSLEQAGTPS
jgi:RNA polymerase-binding transcription factor DksA